MIYVTKTYLPDLAEYIPYLEEIWKKRQVTNHGANAILLESRIKETLGVPHLIYVGNGTIALQIAIKAANLTGEIITTPFSYVATTAGIVWEGCTPVFADIDPDTLCIDPALVESKITDRTTAILATHVYGNCCDVEALDNIAKRYGLALIYDAAHAFGVTVKGKSILAYGDYSTLSFHATKLFHTIEGGAIICKEEKSDFICRYMRHFGHNPEGGFYGLGINGKNTELHAAIGLCLLPKIGELIAKRKEVSDLYDELLSTTVLKRPTLHPDISYNYAYYPVLFPTEKQLEKTKQQLLENGIDTRRYFYPSLHHLNYVESQACPVSEDISLRVLCLPIFHDLRDDDIRRISSLIKASLI